MQVNHLKDKLSKNFQEHKAWIKTKWKEAEKDRRIEPILVKATAIRKSVTERISQFF